MTENRVAARLRAVTGELDRIRDAVVRQLGGEFDKNAVTDGVKELAEALRAMGAWDTVAIGATHPEFLKLCEEFRGSALKEAFEQLERAEAPREVREEGRTTGGYVSLKIVPMLAAERFVRHAGTLVKAAERQATALEGQYRDVDPAAQANAILQLLDNVHAQVEELEQGGGYVTT
jgi:hypothetical protein